MLADSLALCQQDLFHLYQSVVKIWVLSLSAFPNISSKLNFGVEWTLPPVGSYKPMWNLASHWKKMKRRRGSVFRRYSYYQKRHIKLVENCKFMWDFALYEFTIFHAKQDSIQTNMFSYVFVLFRELPGRKGMEHCFHTYVFQ